MESVSASPEQRHQMVQQHVPTDLYPVEGLGTGGIEGTVEGG